MQFSGSFREKNKENKKIQNTRIQSTEHPVEDPQSYISFLLISLNKSNKLNCCSLNGSGALIQYIAVPGTLSLCHLGSEIDDR